MRDLFAAPAGPPLPPAASAPPAKNTNRAWRCRVCGADAAFGFGIGALYSTWYCGAHRAIGAKAWADGRP